MEKMREPKLLDIAVCQKGELGIITKIKKMKKSNIYLGVTISPDNLECLGKPWQSVNPNIIGSLPIILTAFQTVASVTGDAMRDLQG